MARFACKLMMIGTLVSAVAFATTGCKRSPDPSNPQEPTAEAVPSETLQPAPDGINQAIAPDEFARVRLSQVESPRQTEGGTHVLVTIEVENRSTQTRVGRGSNPVNLGVQVLSSDGKPEPPDGLLDFIRQPLPPIEPGEGAAVTLAIPVDARSSGRTLRLALVQEPLRWYDTPTDQPIEIGPFSACDTRICDVAGAPLPSAAGTP